jgi:hypothetical protein
VASLPVPANTTCDIYRSASAPPAAPDVAGVSCYLAPKGQSTLTTPYYTHVLLVPQGTDLRDDYVAGDFTGVNGGDHVWIPDKNGTRFDVILVRRVGRGTSVDHLMALVKRSSEPWPTQNL